MSIGYEGLGDLGSDNRHLQGMHLDLTPETNLPLYIVVRKHSDSRSFSSNTSGNSVHYLFGEAALKQWIESNSAYAKSARIFRAEELEFKLELTLTSK